MERREAFKGFQAQRAWLAVGGGAGISDCEGWVFSHENENGIIHAFSDGSSLFEPRGFRDRHLHVNHPELSQRMLSMRGIRFGSGAII